jgi:hypothetical protein
MFFPFVLRLESDLLVLSWRETVAAADAFDVSQHQLTSSPAHQLTRCIKASPIG